MGLVPLLLGAGETPDNRPSAIILLAHMRLISHMAGIAAKTTLSGSDLHSLRIQLVAGAGAALLALIVTVTLSIYKSHGMTSYGRRKYREQRNVSHAVDM